MNSILNLFNRGKAPMNLYHPDFKNKIEFAVKLNGTKYYCFKEDIDMPYGRYQYLATFLQAVELRMDLTTLNAYIDRIEKSLAITNGKMNVGDAMIALTQLKTRTKIVFDEDIAYNLASCVYFTDDEPLDGYSMSLNKKKIEAWREAHALDFFMLRPVRELLGLKNTSLAALMTYSKQTQPILNELNSAMRQAGYNVNSITK